MKGKLLAGALVLGLAGLRAATGQDEREVRPPATGQSRVRETPRRMERGTYLGLSVDRADETLSRQLGLPGGVGLTVLWVDPAGPSAALLREHDVLHKMNDQLLVLPEQLSVLVRMHKPGQTVCLTVIREGKSLEAKAELAERELPGPEERRPGGAGFREGPKIRFQRIAPSGSGEQLKERLKKWGERLPQELQRELREIFEKSEPPLAPPDPLQPGRPAPERDAGAVPEAMLRFGSRRRQMTVWNDGAHTITVTGDSNGRRLTVKNAAGSTLFEGNPDLEADLDRLSPELLEKLEMLNALRVDLAPEAAPGRNAVL